MFCAIWWVPLPNSCLAILLIFISYGYINTASIQFKTHKSNEQTIWHEKTERANIDHFVDGASALFVLRSLIEADVPDGDRFHVYDDAFGKKVYCILQLIDKIDATHKYLAKLQVN